MRIFVIVLMLLGAISCTKKDHAPHTRLPSENRIPHYMIQAALESRLITRDSGKEVTAGFLKSCIKEKSDLYIEFLCDDLLWSYFARAFVSEDNIFIYLVEEGASVENRKLFLAKDGKIKTLEEPIGKILNQDIVPVLLNKRFKTNTYSVSALHKSAHSTYRTRLPKIGNKISIISGLMVDESHSFKEIAVIEFIKGEFVLKTGNEL
jgi:hypothetical protein